MDRQIDTLSLVIYSRSEHHKLRLNLPTLEDGSTLIRLGCCCSTLVSAVEGLQGKYLKYAVAEI